MRSSAIRTGVVAAPRPGQDGVAWGDFARRAESQGWTTLLVPDTLWTASPFVALAVAGAVTTTLRLRTWVLASPFRTASAVVREASSLQQLSAGRFELGIGAGRPDAEAEAARLGAVWGSARDRIGRVEQVVHAVREQVQPVPAVVIAAAGPRLVSVAARVADRIALALPPEANEDDLSAAVQRVHAEAAGEVALTLQVAGIGDRLPTWLARQGLDAGHLAEVAAVGLLRGDAAHIADTLVERRERLGIDEVVIPAELADLFLPVLDRL